MYINVEYFGTLGASVARPPKISSLNHAVKQVHKSTLMITNIFALESKMVVGGWGERSGVESCNQLCKHNLNDL